MKAIVLCAGQGARLRPHTDDRPKGMVVVGGRTILERQIALFHSVGIDDLVVVGGYRHDTLPAGVAKRINEEYATTNMVMSLFAAEQDMLSCGSVIVSYGDILYSRDVLEAVVAARDSANVVIDLEWYDYFSQRSDDVLGDAETLRLDGLRIIDIGGKADHIDEIEGQYIGLMKFDREAIDAMSAIVHSTLAAGSAIGWGRPTRGAYMTDLLQEMITRGIAVSAVPIRGGWCEIDTPMDLALAEEKLPAILG